MTVQSGRTNGQFKDILTTQQSVTADWVAVGDPISIKEYQAFSIWITHLRSISCMLS